MRWLFLLMVLFSSCGDSTRASYKVGVDASWYPLSLEDRTVAITAFSTELLSAIGTLEKIAFTKITVNWDDLLPELQQGKYDAILSSMPPYLFNQKLYRFSSPYLLLGPVLVVRASSSIKSLDDLRGQEIAILTGSTDNLALEKSPGVLIRYYDSKPQMLNDIVNKTLDGALIDHLAAVAYLSDLYTDTLKIVTPPLTEAGLRLITSEKTSPALIEQFNAGLEKLQKEETYTQLLKKWGLA